MSAPLADQAYRVVIIDDDQFLLDMYTLKFKESGCAVEGFLNSREALDHLRATPNPDALLLDLVMPGLDGIGILKAVRQEKLCDTHTAVVVLSNQGQQSDIEKASAYAIDGYLIKAATVPSEVLTNVLQTIEKKQGQKA